MAETGIPVLAPTLQTGASAGASIAAAAVAGHTLAFSSLAVPVIGAAIAGVTLAIGLWLNRKGPKQKVATTKIVEEALQFFQQNLDAWNSSSKSSAEQQQAIANYQNIYNAWVNACASDEMGEPGHRCIEERLAPGTTVNVNGKTYVGNGRFGDVPTVFLAPILNDPMAGQGESSISNLFSSTGGMSGGLLLGIGLLIGGIVLMTGLGD